VLEAYNNDELGLLAKRDWLINIKQGISKKSKNKLKYGLF
jgi:hypothetical protein